MIIGMAVLVVILDQVVKYIVQHSMELGQTIPLIPHVFHLTYILNPGAAFGILANQSWFLLLIALALFVAFFIYRKRMEMTPLYFQAAVGMLLGGTLGNAIDRLRLHAVVDFFDFRIWPIFNVADMAICCGIALILLFYWRRAE